MKIFSSARKRRRIAKLKREISKITFRETLTAYQLCRGDRIKLEGLRAELRALEGRS